MKYRYDRPTYLSLLERYRDTDYIKVLKGVRRCGKSTLLSLFMDSLLLAGIPASNLIRRRFDEFDMPLGTTAEDLQHDVAGALLQADPAYPAYVFLDEMQMVPGWERVVRGLHTRENTDVYITGSNAYLLSSDLATLLAGRYVELDVYPLSFKEYVDFCAQSRLDAGAAIDERFARYVRYGGMPSLFALRDSLQEDYVRELGGIYDTVIINDVAKRFSIRDYVLLERLVAYVFSTSGNLFSTKKVSDYLKSAGFKAAPETVDDYLHALEQALILHEVRQEGLQGKQLLRPLRKFYAVDTGLRNLSLGFKVRDIGFQLENVVYMELLRRGYAVAVGALQSAEIDFVGRRGDEVVYIQVSDNLDSEATLERELAPLRRLADSFPKLLLTTDRLRAGYTPDGCRVVHIIDWLLE